MVPVLYICHSHNSSASTNIHLNFLCALVLISRLLKVPYVVNAPRWWTWRNSLTVKHNLCCSGQWYTGVFLFDPRSKHLLFKYHTFQAGHPECLEKKHGPSKPENILVKASGFKFCQQSLEVHFFLIRPFINNNFNIYNRTVVQGIIRSIVISFSK